MSFLDEAVSSYFERERSVYPQRSNWPSQLGIDCSRQLLWNRTRWAEKALPEPSLMRRFRLGKMLEPALVRLLEDAGITVEQTQRPLVDDELELSGKIDGLVRDREKRVWVPDFKTASGNGFRTVVRAGTAEGLLQSEKAYLRGYPLQVGFYARMLDLETGGLLFFANKESLETFTIEVRLDDPAVIAAMELKRDQLLVVNSAIAAGEDLPPEPGDHCRDCPFLTKCVPDLAFGPGLSALYDAELAEKIARHEELKEAHHEYEHLDEDLREAFTEPGETSVGGWLVVAKPSSRTVYDIPADVKAPYAKKVSGVRRSYLPILEASSADIRPKAAPDAPFAPRFVDLEPRPAPEALLAPPAVLSPPPALPAATPGAFDL
jgi:hypothetical protein